MEAQHSIPPSESYDGKALLFMLMCSINLINHHHHHHDVPEGLGMFPVS